MRYEGIVIRPPSEAHSIILQVTVGCSYNRCAFCGAYRGVGFRIRSTGEIDRDLDFVRRYCTRQNRMFLADGDALVLPQQRLEELLEQIRRQTPWIRRVSLYANARAIRGKSDTDLQRLRQRGLDRIYLGVESGDDTVLEEMNKGETARSQEESGRRIKAAGFFLSTTVILGLAGSRGSRRHAVLTAELLNRLRPNQIAALSLMVLDNSPLGRKSQTGEFQAADRQTIMREMFDLLDHLHLDRAQFMANHASNYLPLSGRLQRDKPKMLVAVQAAMDGRVPLVSENLRAL